MTITDAEMSRFVMSIEESVRLVIESARVARGGEVFVTKMPVLRIVDLADAMIQVFAPMHSIDPASIGIDVIGTKPGEKLYEELMSDEETRRTVELSEFFAVLPAFRGIYRDIEYQYEAFVSDQIEDPYISSVQRKLDVQEIVELLTDYNLIGETETSQLTRYWPGENG